MKSAIREYVYVHARKKAGEEKDNIHQAGVRIVGCLEALFGSNFRYVAEFGEEQHGNISIGSKVIGELRRKGEDFIITFDLDKISGTVIMEAIEDLPKITKNHPKECWIFGNISHRESVIQFPKTA